MTFYYHLISCMSSEVYLRGEGVCLNSAKLFFTFPLTHPSIHPPSHPSIHPSQTESRTKFAMGNISLWHLHNREKFIWAKPPVMLLNKTTLCISFTAILIGWNNWKRWLAIWNLQLCSHIWIWYHPLPLDHWGVWASTGFKNCSRYWRFSSLLLLLL